MIKVERRGKYGGVKVHLDAEECQKLMEAAGVLAPKSYQADLISIAVPLSIAKKMGEKIKELLAEDPDLLKDRTDAEVAAILAKESEKAAMQLNAIKSGKKWQKVDGEGLKQAMSKVLGA